MNKELELAISSVRSRVATATSERKGASGTILVIGGCRYYTGAPYFVSLAALFTGSEIVYVFSEPEAIPSLKSLLPESIVCGIEYQEWILQKVTACVVGPGLGRPSETTCKEIRKILVYLSRRSVPVIVDGDGIRLAGLMGIERFGTVIVTPNASEQKHIEEPNSRFFYVKKGPSDVILWGGEEVKVDGRGCPKRIGGQGDILAGTIASLVSRLESPAPSPEVMGSIVVGCRMVREAGRLAYERYWKGLITRDILEGLRDVFKQMAK